MAIDDNITDVCSNDINLSICLCGHRDTSHGIHYDTGLTICQECAEDQNVVGIKVAFLARYTCCHNYIEIEMDNLQYLEWRKKHGTR